MPSSVRAVLQVVLLVALIGAASAAAGLPGKAAPFTLRTLVGSTALDNQVAKIRVLDQSGSAVDSAKCLVFSGGFTGVFSFVVDDTVDVAALTSVSLAANIRGDHTAPTQTYEFLIYNTVGHRWESMGAVDYPTANTWFTHESTHTLGGAGEEYVSDSALLIKLVTPEAYSAQLDYMGISLESATAADTTTGTDPAVGGTNSAGTNSASNSDSPRSNGVQMFGWFAFGSVVGSVAMVAVVVAGVAIQRFRNNKRGAGRAAAFAAAADADIEGLEDAYSDNTVEAQPARKSKLAKVSALGGKSNDMFAKKGGKRVQISGDESD